MNGEYKVFIPLDDRKTTRSESPKGKTAQEWRKHWHILRSICKSLRKSKTRYEVEYHLAAEFPYAVILAGTSCRQMILREAA